MSDSPMQTKTIEYLTEWEEDAEPRRITVKTLEVTERKAAQPHLFRLTALESIPLRFSGRLLVGSTVPALEGCKSYIKREYHVLDK